MGQRLVIYADAFDSAFLSCKRDLNKAGTAAEDGHRTEWDRREREINDKRAVNPVTCLWQALEELRRPIFFGVESGSKQL